MTEGRPQLERIRCDRPACQRRVMKSAAWLATVSYLWEKGIAVYSISQKLCPMCGKELEELLELFLAGQPRKGGKMSAVKTQLTVRTLIIERAMRKAGLEKQELAQKVGVANSAITRLLDGTHKNITLIVKVCKVLNLPLEQAVKAIADKSMGASTQTSGKTDLELETVKGA